MVRIQSLEGIRVSELYETFSEAFAGYAVSWTFDAFERMLERRGFSPSLSFGAFDQDRLVSFTFNGIGQFNGQWTAYDTGTGTIPDYRGQGLAATIFGESLPHLRQYGIRQYLLEVLQENETAISLYKKQGFEITRPLNVFRINTHDWQNSNIDPAPDVTIREIDFSFRDTMQAMWDFQPSWQNRFDALLKNPNHFIVLGAFTGTELLGYGVIEPASGDIPQLAVHRNQRHRKIGSHLLHALCEKNDSQVIKVVNTEAGYEPITAFLAWNGIPKMTGQFEMSRSLF
jgi:ribosomal protein S18 acetylase RimI-like enzyme